MKQFWMGAAALSLLTACGDGNPFTGGTTGGGPTTVGTIPAPVRGDLGSFVYNPTTQNLTVTGLTADASDLNGTYTRNAALDVPGYEAYSTQRDGTSRHVTAYVRQIDGVTGAITVTGGQFGFYYGGGAYSRATAFDRATGVVQYAGDYVGLTNLAGDGGDLLPAPGGTPVGLLPSQSAEVTGQILFTADFTDNSVEGRVTNRTLVDAATAVEDIDLAPTALLADGTFAGNVSQGGINRGQYGGVFGGTDSRVVAGSLFASNHMSTVTDEEEHGLFVLVQCGTAGASPICP